MEYELRVSRRARRMSLNVSRRGNVEVVVPERHSQRAAERFVATHRDWIRRTRADLLRRYGPAPAPVRPDAIPLRAIPEVWPVEFLERATEAPGLASRDGRITIAGHGLTLEAVRPLLLSWLQRRARAVLVPWVDALAVETGLHPARVQVRGQRSRWGSCSATGTVSINRALLFLPPTLARYVIVHELCHLGRLDHSPAFWAAVEGHCPGARALDNALDAARGLVPAWADPAQRNRSGASSAPGWTA